MRVAAALLFALPAWSPAWGGPETVPLDLSADATIHSAGVELAIAGDDNRNATVGLEYKASADASWTTGHPLVRIDPATFVGSAFFLRPDTLYDMRVAVDDPDGADPSQLTAQVRTGPDRIDGTTSVTLWVSPDGDDGNAGTNSGAPLRTIQRAADLAGPGTRVIVMPGVYRQQVAITTSGTAEAPIIYESWQYATDDGSSPAVLEGADPALAVIDEIDNWLPDPDHPGVYYTDGYDQGSGRIPLYVARGTEKIYAYTYYPYDPASCSFDNFIDEVFCGSGTCVPSEVDGGWFWDEGAERLYVKLPGGGDPDQSVMNVAPRHTRAFLIQGASHVVIRGFEIRFHQTGIHVRGDGPTEHIVIERNDVHNTRYGISLGGFGSEGLSINHCVIQDNLVWDTKVAEWPWAAVKLSDVESNGISMGAGRGHIIRRNRVHDVFNGIDLSIWWALTAPGYQRETDIYDNEVWDVGDDAIEPEGAMINVRVWGNRVFRVQRDKSAAAGVSVAPVTVGPTWVIRNLLTDHQQTAIKFPANYGVPSGPVLIYHNTMYSTVGDLVAVQRDWGPIPPGLKARFRNNVLVAAGTRDPGAAVSGYVFEDTLADHSDPPVVYDMDYDNFFTTRDCGGSVCNLLRWKVVTYNELAGFQAASGQEANGSAVDPQFQDPASLDFRLRPESPLIDAGLLLPGINDDHEGAGPDPGAFEASDPCPWDLDSNGDVGVMDLATLLAGWGAAAGGPADIDGDGVGPADLVAMVVNWGGCGGNPSAYVLWRHAESGDNELWIMDGKALLSGSGPLPRCNASWKTVGLGDFNGDGEAHDILWRHDVTRKTSVWLLSGTSLLPGTGPVHLDGAAEPVILGARWAVAGTGDFDGDGRTDILWRNQRTGKNSLWLMAGTAILGGSGSVEVLSDPDWTLAGTGDLDGDGRSDILWRHQRTGENTLWLMSGRTILPASGPVAALRDTDWALAGTGDFNGDGRADLLWRHQRTGRNSLWLMSGTVILAGSGPVQTVSNTSWTVVATPDFNDDGRSDILWRHLHRGKNSLWFMSGAAIQPGSGPLQTVDDTSWTVVGGCD